MKKLIYPLLFLILIVLVIRVFSPFATDHSREERLLNARPLLDRYADTLFVLIKVREGWTPEELESMQDPWGQVIQAEYNGKILTLKSSGPDRKFETKDDIKVERTIE
jgi:hypothetical protein